MTTFALNKLFLFGHCESLLTERLPWMVRRLLVRLFEELLWVIPFPPVQGRNRSMFGREVILTYLASVLCPSVRFLYVRWLLISLVYG
jgi:hypothetical protein